MKKFFVSLVMLLSTSAVSVFAQSALVATLSHEGEITAFYGASALQQAHEAATHGDVITLSSGLFNSTTIKKAITLRGAGMEMDSINNIFPSEIAGNFSINIPDSITEQFTMEGIFHAHTMGLLCDLKDASFSKCRFGEIAGSSTGVVPTKKLSATFLHCKIAGHIRFPRQVKESWDVTFINCYLVVDCYSNDNCGNYSFINCIFDLRSPQKIQNLSYLTTASFKNSIIIGKNQESDYLAVRNTANNCVSINCGSIDGCFVNMRDKTNKNAGQFSDLFKTFDGTYSDYETFELTDDAKTKFLGDDGNEVGIHGGAMPFDYATFNPRIVNCEVAPKSTPDGKLRVSVEIGGAE